MKISEVIKSLEFVQEGFGDLEVFVDWGEEAGGIHNYDLEFTVPDGAEIADFIEEQGLPHGHPTTGRRLEIS